MKVSKLAELTEDELRREEATLQDQIFRLRFQMGTGNIENPSRLGMVRKDLARVKTIIREKELKLNVVHRSKGAPSEGAAKVAKRKAAGSSSEAK